MSESDVMGYDHASTSLLAVLRGANIPVAGKLEDCAAAKIAIVHTLDEVGWESVLNESPCGAVRVRTSTSGRQGWAHRVTDRGVIELQLHTDHQQISADELKFIAEELLRGDAARDIAQGRPPLVLVRYFCAIVPEVLPALSILCQGYLVVHCGPARSADGFKVDDVVGDSSMAVEDALQRMKWGEVLKSAGSLVPALISPDGAQRKQLQNTVSEASFWAVLDHADAAKVAEAAEKEWKSLAANALDFAASKAKALIDALPLEDGATAGSDFPRRVAEAYVEIAERMVKSL